MGMDEINSFICNARAWGSMGRNRLSSLEMGITRGGGASPRSPGLKNRTPCIAGWLCHTSIARGRGHLYPGLRSTIHTGLQFRQHNPRLLLVFPGFVFVADVGRLVALEEENLAEAFIGINLCRKGRAVGNFQGDK